MEEVEGYLLNALDETTRDGDHNTVITIVNELIGFYRDTSQYEKSLFYCNQILPFMKELGLEGDRPIHNLLKRQRRKATNEKPKHRGRKPAKTLQEYKYENKRLKMEVDLLRDFLRLGGRK